MSRKYKYTVEAVTDVVNSSISIFECLRKLGRKLSGGNHTNLKKYIHTNKIDISHFLGKGHNKGKRFCNKASIDYLVNREGNGKSQRRQTAALLRKALIENGREYKCERCNQLPIWLDEPLILEIHHKNGNWLDDQFYNLEFLCPNCHSQADIELKKEKQNKKIKKKCIYCNHYTKKGERIFCSTFCSNKYNRLKYRNFKIEWPAKEELLKMVENSNYVQVGKLLGVSDTAIRKHLKNN